MPRNAAVSHSNSTTAGFPRSAPRWISRRIGQSRQAANRISVGTSMCRSKSMTPNLQISDLVYPGSAAAGPAQSLNPEAVCRWAGAMTPKYRTNSTSRGPSRHTSRRRVVDLNHSLTTADTPSAAQVNTSTVRCVRYPSTSTRGTR